MKELLITLLLIIIIIVSCFFSLMGENIFVKKALWPFASGLHFLANKVSCFFRPFAQHHLWEEENRNLRARLNRALSLNARLYVLERENAILRQYLNLKKERFENLVLARVMGKRENNGSVWFVINKGSKDGLRVGMPVVNQEGILLGKIAKVKETISFFWPVYDSHFSTAAIIKPIHSTSTEVVNFPFTGQGIVEGKYGLEVKMSYIPKDVKLSVGDMVMTSGLEEQIQQGIIIGEISKIKKSPDSLFQEATIHPLFEEGLDIVAIPKR